MLHPKPGPSLGLLLKYVEILGSKMSLYCLFFKSVPGMFTMLQVNEASKSEKYEERWEDHD